ncbi:MAG: bifunctional adenosylcobinamide kinase/adenosylcobinamide-phosphate guanylyltransferase [Bacillota bacterium]
MIELVVGGARSGKSSFAEKQFQGLHDVVYIATARVEDDEMRERVKHHRENRSSVWRTFEGNYNLSEAVGDEGNYLLDCLTVLASNIMFDMTYQTKRTVPNVLEEDERIGPELQRQVEDRIYSEVVSLIDAIEEKGYNLVMVTNEVGYSIVPENHIGRVFMDIQGRLNQRVAAKADKVHLVCCGIPVRIK